MDVLELAKMGWRLIAMRSQSKNPGSLVGDGWPAKCSCNPEVIAAWLDILPDANFGVLLGPSSGLIDLEYDTEEGKEIIEEACQSIATPTYRSAKSVHRLFAYDERFSHEKAKFGWRGTEWRFGQDAAQSVIPPSVHETGAKYEWIVPPGVPLARMPDELWDLFNRLKIEFEASHAKQRPVTIAPRDRTGDSLLDHARIEAEKLDWESLLSSRGWTFCRNRGEAQDWWRPGKKGGSISGTVNYGGSGTLRVFSLSCDPLEAESSYDKFAFLCVLDHEDDPIAAAKAIVPQHVQDELHKQWRAEQDRKNAAVDLSALIGTNRSPDTDDEEFCEAMIPKTGLIGEIANFCTRSSYKPSPVFSLASAISFCQTIFGRKVMSETNLRTNDFHLILAPTSAGKEGPLDLMNCLFTEAEAASYIMPVSISSASAMLDCLDAHPHFTQNWVCDEFGHVLSVILDKKNRDTHSRGIAKKMLELYGKSKSTYTGGAFSGNVKKHHMIQPHLCALGVSTGFTVFQEVSISQIMDGLIGRICFWSLQKRPAANRQLDTTVPPELVQQIKSWIQFNPTGKSNMIPAPVQFEFTPDARERWYAHDDKISETMEYERAVRSALWGRTAARSMKLALTHRAARADVSELNEFSKQVIELEDVEWGIAISNHCTRLACSLINETVVDTIGNRLADKVLAIVKAKPDGISKSDLKGRLKTADAGSIWAAVKELESAGSLCVWSEPTKGRPREMVGVKRGDKSCET